MAQKNIAVSRLIPSEFFEPNLRLYSFIFLIAAASIALYLFPVGEFKGYIDPFYSPTILVLPLVGLYRLTCYAYRKDYNRHVFKHPVACPVYTRMDGPQRSYTGETSSLFKVENLHRYFLYSAIAILPFFYYDLVLSLMYSGGIILRIGSIVLAVNAVLITLYVFSCHSLRSLIGGRKDCFSCMANASGRKKFYDVQSGLNAHHEQIAWASLVFIVFTDLYMRALSAGIPLDHVIFHILKL
ncbi:MAG: succinate dehydrogenase [Candidatus Marsarchaeota archaeon]|jgi:hypothetical protein|nr:succinate dehydrogenase [Candidatus Marsarchaeota archaeon]MCL5112198.1 succinate dehydrogenase [Candidatus Marsarchaeota archaeon]